MINILTANIDKELKAAMLSKNTTRLTALRALKSALINKADGKELSDTEALNVVQKQIKQRKDSSTIYKEQNRPELEAVEEAEILILTEFLPKQMSVEEVTVILEQIILKSGASSVKDTGKVMGLATKELAGKIDNKTIGEIVKKILS